jgi:hypothetical protein
MTRCKGSSIVYELTGAYRLRAHQRRNADKKYEKGLFDHNILFQRLCLQQQFHHFFGSDRCFHF